VEAEILEQRIASLEARLGETFDLLRTLVSLVSQINVESYLGTMEGAPPDERRKVYEDIRHELAAMREKLEKWSEQAGS
jgi:uncharacterized coiled-coil protein SlyX